MPSRSSMMQPHRQVPPECLLTLGLEAEFYAAIMASSFNRNVPHENIPNLLGTRLRKLHLSGPEGYGSRFNVAFDPEKHPEEDRVVDYSRWNLTKDATAQPQNPKWFAGYEGQPIEIISPPYWAHTAYWENDIQRIFSSRVGQFNPISENELRLYCELNNTTSFHVHIGNGVDPDSSFPFRTVRNLAMILLVYEHVIDKLFDAKLYPIPTLVGTRDRSQEPQSLSPADTPYFQPPNLPDWSSRKVLALHLLYTCLDIQSVVRAMSPLHPEETSTPDCPWYYKYNFNPLLGSLDVPPPAIPAPEAMEDNETLNGHPEPTLSLPPPGPQTQPQPRSSSGAKQKAPTIEFRQQIGTLDPDNMVHWIRFLVALVEFSSKLTDLAVIEFLGLENIEIDYELWNDEPHIPMVTIGPPIDPSLSHSAFAIFLSTKPVGSFGRLLAFMDCMDVELDYETTRHWRRKVSP